MYLRVFTLLERIDQVGRHGAHEIEQNSKRHHQYEENHRHEKDFP